MADSGNYSNTRADIDYSKATRAGCLRRIGSILTGQSIELIPFEDLKKSVGFQGQRYRGLRPVSLDKIIGSWGRSRDFDRAFLPIQRHSRQKWLSIDRAYHQGISLPAVSLYKVGDAYFVVDGHHRVSVARRQGQTFIDAEVIEVESRVPVTADLTLQDLDVVAAYRAFLEETRLDELRPDHDIHLTMPGDYVRLLEHIRVHKYFVDQDRETELTWEQAVTDWYDNVYLPVYETIVQNDLLADFPGRTAADLYFWIIEHAYHLSQEFGQSLPPGQVARDYVARFGKSPRRWIQRLRRRVADLLIPDELASGPPPGTWRAERVEVVSEDVLFRDILVALSGAETGWLALSQAAEIARLEGSTVRGLHVTRSQSEKDVAQGQEILEEFRLRSQSLGIKATANMAHGDVAEEIVERARWADLVVINQRRIHGEWAERPLGTIFQTVVTQSARPVLAVPGTRVVPLRRALLAYDGSPKAREALFVFRHALTHWGLEGTLLMVESASTDREMLDHAWEYAQASGANVTTRFERGEPEHVITRVMGSEEADLLIMGGSGYRPILKAFLGSTVNRVLRVAWFPVLICR
jgi:nucleotide-binding universal stress UspA family protein